MPVWNDLSVKQKAGLMKVFVNNGIYNLDTMRDMFDKDISHLSSSNAEFVNRLRNNDTRSISNPDGTVSTHKMSYGEEDGKHFVYPEIQDVNGKLIDYSGDRMNAMRQAIANGDTVQVSKPVADWYSNNNYKKMYPDFANRFDNGGQEYSGGKVPASYKTESLTRDQWTNLVKNNKVSINQVPSQYRNWIQGETSQYKQDVTDAMDRAGKTTFKVGAALAGTLMGASLLTDAAPAIGAGLRIGAGYVAKKAAQFAIEHPQLVKTAVNSLKIIDYPLTALGTADVVYRNATGRGVQRTAQLYKDLGKSTATIGDLGKAVGSTAMDLLDLGMVASPVIGITKRARAIKRLDSGIDAVNNSYNSRIDLLQNAVNSNRKKANTLVNYEIGPLKTVSDKARPSMETKLKSYLDAREQRLKEFYHSNNSNYSARYRRYGTTNPDAAKVDYAGAMRRYDENIINSNPADYIDPAKVTYDKKTHLYTINMFDKNLASSPIDGINTGDYSIPKFSTGEQIKGNFDLAYMPTGASKYYPQFKITTDVFNPDRIVVVPNTILAKKIDDDAIGGLSYIRGDYDKFRQVTKDNLEYLKQLIPGAKPFGSSVNVADAGFPHITHDYDFEMMNSDFQKFIAAHPEINYTDVGQLKTLHLNKVGKTSSPTDIDLNIIPDASNELIDSYGAGMSREAELFSQQYPDEYDKVRRTAVEVNGTDDFTIPHSNKELFDNMNPTTKTLIDSFEIDVTSPGKEKHAARPIVSLMFGDTNASKEALNAYKNEVFGTNGKLLDIDDSLLQDPDENIKFLKSINIPNGFISKDAIHNPERMKNIINYWYIQNSGYGRGLNTQNFIGTPDIDLAASKWHPSAIGGSYEGVGLNTVAIGNSGVGRLYTYNQVISPEMLDIKNAKSLSDINTKMQYYLGKDPNGIKLDFNEPSGILRKTIPNLEGKSKITSQDILHETSFKSGQEYQDMLDEIYRQTGIPLLSANHEHGSATYMSATTDMRKFGKPHIQRAFGTGWDTRMDMLSPYNEKLSSEYDIVDKFQNEINHIYDSGVKHSRLNYPDYDEFFYNSLYDSPSMRDYRASGLTKTILEDKHNNYVNLIKDRTDKVDNRTKYLLDKINLLNNDISHLHDLQNNSQNIIKLRGASNNLKALSASPLKMAVASAPVAATVYGLNESINKSLYDDYVKSKESYGKNKTIMDKYNRLLKNSPEKAKKYLPDDKLAKLKAELKSKETDIKFYEANKTVQKYKEKFGK